MGMLQRLCFQDWLSRTLSYVCHCCQVSEFLNIDSVLRADHPLHTVLDCGPWPNGRTQNFLIGLIEYKISLLTADRKSVTRLNGALKHYAIIDIHQFKVFHQNEKNASFTEGTHFLIEQYLCFFINFSVRDYAR